MLNNFFTGTFACKGIANAFFAGTLNSSEDTCATSIPFASTLISSVEILPPTSFGFSKKASAFNRIVSDDILVILILSTYIKTGCLVTEHPIRINKIIKRYKLCFIKFF